MKYILYLLFVISILDLKAETGRETYSFLNMPTSAKIASVGGMNVSIATSDINLAYYNPALLTDTLNNSLSLSYVDYLLDSKVGFVSYARKIGNLGIFNFGVHYVSYGTFDNIDATDTNIGEFSAKEYEFFIAGHKKLGKHLNAGLTFKPIYSVLETYQSFGLLVDVGIHYSNTDKTFSTGAVVRNIGGPITTYTDDSDSNVPFNIVAGSSFKLRHAPFRFSVTLNQMDELDLTYKSAFDDQSIGSETSYSFGDKLFRHVILGAEFVPSKNFFVSFGYNFRRKQELKIDENVGSTGLSWGFGLRVSKYHISYGSARYHLSGTTNHFTISTNLNSFVKQPF